MRCCFDTGYSKGNACLPDTANLSIPFYNFYMFARLVTHECVHQADRAGANNDGFEIHDGT
ncbi:MAG: hypothetical protein B7Y80_20860 [Hyphomicrobium sp. 32-62-53]|nr:MAG: hypothetical protein B7Y80_20860 [Hyphomicrobium sp. 32-62-53]